jgi:hypothetical protein
MASIIAFSAAVGAIDTELGIIRGVSLITEGPALGHGVMIDAKTLQQVKAAADLYSGGLKVKLDHNSGAGEIIGFISNLRIVGPKLLGDLNLLASSPHRGYVLEIAQKIPDTFGLSIAFSGPSEPSSDKLTTLQRCSEIYSVDLVSEPAANPDGFFSRKAKLATEKNDQKASPKTEYAMTPEPVKTYADDIQTAIMPLIARLDKIEAALAADAVVDAAGAAVMSAKNDVVQLAANAAALAAVKEFAKSFGAPAAPIASAEAPKPVAQAQKFEEVVAAKATELKGDKSAAISFAIKNHADLYAAYRARVQGGEIVKL